MGVARPDIVVYCDDGHEEHLVQRFRWLTEYGIWKGTRKAAAEIPIYPGDTPRSSGLDGPVAERGRWELRCPICLRNEPVRTGRMMMALSWLAGEKQRRVSLKLLPVLLKKWPSDVRGVGGQFRY